MTEVKWTSSRIARLLEERHPKDVGKWVTIRELRDATGHSQRVTLDLVAMGMWPSMGFQLIGYEIKVSRADWLREVKNPSKRAPWAGQLNELWVVAPAGMVEDHELPNGWGLLVPTKKGDKLRTIKRPTPDDKAEPTRPLWASIFRAILGEQMRLREEIEDVTTFAGRPLSLQGLRALVDLYHSRVYGMAERIERIEEERKRDSARNSRKLDLFLDNEFKIVREVASILGLAPINHLGFHGPTWNKKKEDFLRALEVVKDVFRQMGIDPTRLSGKDKENLGRITGAVRGYLALDGAWNLADRLEAAAITIRKELENGEREGKRC